MTTDPDSNTTTSESAAASRRSIFKVHIRAPIHKVWAELTKTDSVLPFFFNGTCRSPGLEVGAPIRMVSKDGKYTSVAGEVIEFDPPHRYAHTFRFTNLDDAPCMVRYVLEETPEGTNFTLINENVPEGTKTEKYMTQGGAFITRNLKALLETGRPTTGGRIALFMMGLFSPLTPKVSRSENWPFDRQV